MAKQWRMWMPHYQWRTNKSREDQDKIEVGQTNLGMSSPFHHLSPNHLWPKRGSTEAPHILSTSVLLLLYICNNGHPVYTYILGEDSEAEITRAVAGPLLWPPFVNLVGVWATPLKNISQVNGKHDIPYTMENNTCLKPPTSKSLLCLESIGPACFLRSEKTVEKLSSHGPHSDFPRNTFFDFQVIFRTVPRGTVMGAKIETHCQFM